MRKARGGGGGAGGSKAFSSSAGRHCRVQKNLLVVAWEATNVYCAFNVLEVDLLQGVRKSGSWMHVSDSGSHLGVGEARVRHGGSPK